MKKNKKLLLVLGSIILLITLLTIIFVVMTTPDKTTTLTALEKRWVEQNKNKVINIAVLNNIPLYGDEGKGLFFDFLDDFENDVHLEFNKIPYNYGGTATLDEYKFEVTDKVNNNQILIFQDNYVAISKEKIKINDLRDFENKRIGTLDNKLSDVTYYMAESKATFGAKDDIDKLLESFKKGDFDYIIIPYNIYLDEILASEYHIVYNFKDIYENYVLTLSDNNETVNTILKKYIELWKINKLNNLYSEKFNTLYFETKNISNKSQADFKGKIYTYGYVENLPYETLANKKLIGINGEYINTFANLTNIEIKFKKFNSIEELNKAFKNGEIDIMFNNSNSENNNINNAYQTIPVHDNNYVIITNINSNKVINSVKSLKNETVYVLKNSLLADYINKNVSVQLKTYDNNKKVLNNLKDDMIIVMDYDTYNYYKSDKLSRFNIAYMGNTNYNYNFIINEKDNKVLAQMFDYYTSSLNYKSIKNNAYQTLIINPKNETTLQMIIGYILYIVLPILIIGTILYVLFNKKKEKNEIKKEEKLRYVDMMTSLKNRNYLNSKVKEWDEGKVYPQTIIIVDLNGIQTINDNFGHEEGDNVIKSAANILIKTQLENSDIIRTDGNEFLIYLIGYSENEIISYMKKLYKEMKELPHGNGAAFGYSMITDDIKLIDDAINEATLDMKTNKES